jgi:hypothetical protein
MTGTLLEGEEKKKMEKRGERSSSPPQNRFAY